MVYLFQGSVGIKFLISVMLMIQIDFFHAVPSMILAVFAFFVLFLAIPE